MQTALIILSAFATILTGYVDSINEAREIWLKNRIPNECIIINIMLNRIKSDISTDLSAAEKSDIKDDITFIDVDKDGYVSYNTMKNAAKLLQDTYPNLVNTILNVVDRDLVDNIYTNDIEQRSNHPGIYTKSRSRIKFGRLINKILPGKYKPNDIEDFTNKWKALIENSAERFEIVEGDDIAYWYKSENYKEQSGSLGSSCMRENSDTTFRIYTMNPEVCRMLILTDGDELVGRSIIWKVATKDKGDWQYFMDRQYAISDSYIEKFRNYAIEQGWAFKTNNNHHSYSNVTWKIDGDTLTSGNIKMSVNLKPYSGEDYDYRRYPYLDTFRRYNPKTGWLYNDDNQKSNPGQYLLEDTSGGYTECESGVYSEWSDEYIPEEEAIYSDQVDSYLWEDRAVEVTRGSRRRRGWYPDGYEQITYDEYYGDYLHLDDTVYSEPYSSSILADDSASAITSISEDGTVNREMYIYAEDTNYMPIYNLINNIWYKKLLERDSDWEEGHIHTHIKVSLLTADFDSEYIPRIFRMVAFSNKEQTKIFSGFDAEILGAEIDKENPLIIDKWRYNSEVSEMYPQILEKAKARQEEIISMLKSDGENMDEETKIKITTEEKKLADRIGEIEDSTWL